MFSFASSQIFPRVKELEFDSEGRPFHPFFYTLRPNLTQTLHDVVETLEECLLFNDRMRSQGKEPDPEQALDETGLTGTRWISKKELEERLMEDVSEEQYDVRLFICTVKRSADSGDSFCRSFYPLLSA